MIPFAKQLKTRIGLFRSETGVWYGKSTSLTDFDDGGADSIRWGQPGDVPVPGDYLGEGLQQLAVFRPSEGNWYIRSSVGRSNLVIKCGREGDIPVPFDYFGEGKPRIAVFRPTDGTWRIKGSELSDWEHSKGNTIIRCGQLGDVPIPADFFGEGLVRLAVYRPSEGKWYIKGPQGTSWELSSPNHVVEFGQNGDIPVPANYFNEEVLRLAVFRPSTGEWIIKANKRGAADVKIKFGQQGDIPVPGDYFGEGVTRLALWRPSNGTWYVKGFGTADWSATDGPVSLFQNFSLALGKVGDIQVARDYTGKGFLRFATFRQSNGTWYISGGKNLELKFGQKGDIAVNADYENTVGETFALYRPSEGKWYLKGEGDESWENSLNNWVVKFGKEDDIPLPLDYFGEGNDRLAVFSAKEGVWRIKQKGPADWDENSGITIDMEAKLGDIPVPSYYLGELNPNLAIYRPSTGTWYIKPNGLESWNDAKGSQIVQCGQEGDIPVPYDFFDEGVVRFAVFRPSTGQWLIKGAGFQDWEKSPANIVVQFGQAGDIPIPFDYFGEGLPRLAVFRPSEGKWYIKAPGMESWDSSNNGDSNVIIHCGQQGDTPKTSLPFVSAALVVSR